MDDRAHHRDLLAAEETFCPKLVAADAWAAQDVDRQQGVALLAPEDEKLREWCWAEAHDSRSATETAPEWWVDESLMFRRAKERQAQRLLDAQEWAAVAVPKALAQMDAP